MGWFPFVLCLALAGVASLMLALGGRWSPGAEFHPASRAAVVGLVVGLALMAFAALLALYAAPGATP